MRRRLTRKDRLELLARRGERMGRTKTHIAWVSLCIELRKLAEPERPRGPRFDDLARAIRLAILEARR